MHSLVFYYKDKKVSDEELTLLISQYKSQNELKLLQTHKLESQLYGDTLSEKSIICKTTFLKNAVKSEEATELFNFLKYNISWEDGIRSKFSGFTRKAKALYVTEIPEVLDVILKTLRKITATTYSMEGIYLNYYENGSHHTPNHSHKGTHQLVISLGETRILTVGNKEYPMENGDAIIFGGSIHGVPKDKSTKGRISIATFMVPCRL